MSDLAQDLNAKAELMYGSTSVASLARAAVADGGSAVLLFRLSKLVTRWGLTPLAWLLTKTNKVLNGITIGVGADIAPGFVIQHSVGVVINGRAVIGPNCVLEGGVVIGSVERRNPILEGNVYVGSGAKVIGDVRIGAGSKIGANSVVVKDVPAGVTVVGIPARVI